MPFIYSPSYYADIGLHVFPIAKYRLIYEKLKAEAGLTESDFLIPEPASQADLLAVHSAEYLDDLTNCRLTERTAYSELPISNEIIDLFVLAAGGTVLASREAFKSGWAMHLSGGFHHAFRAKAEGFCYINDLAVAAKAVQRAGFAKKVAIVDCDLHQGNGTAVIFQGDATVFTFSMHQLDLYPVKEKSDLDMHLPTGITDEPYLAHLAEALVKIFDDFSPELILYQAGADPFQFDQLGGLALTKEGLKQRDEAIFSECKRRQVPIAVTLGGGYAYHTPDTVQIHFNTCVAAREILGD